MSKRKPPSQRQLRVGEAIRHALGEAFVRRELDEPGLDTSTITVTEVQTSPDLRLATVFVRPLTDAGREGLAARLNAARARIQQLAAPALKGMKYMPRLQFRLDPSADHAARIEELLRHPAVARDLRNDEE